MTLGVAPGRAARTGLCAALAWAVVGTHAAPAHASSLFKLADAATVIFRGTVERVTPYPAAKLVVFRFRPDRVLQGEASADEPVDLAQEMLFDSTRPYFEVGARTLVFAIPLPDYSAFRKVLPAGSYLRWAERLDTAAIVAVYADPAFVEPLAQYLAARSDPEALARHLAALLGGAHPRLRVDALAAVEARPEVTPLLDTATLAPVRSLLSNERVPLQERAQILVGLGRAGAAGIGPIAEELSAAQGPLQPAAIDVLVSTGRVPDLQRLLAYSESADPALRIAAARGLAYASAAGAFERLRYLALDDPSDEVRLGALQAVAARPSAPAVPLLEAVVRQGDSQRATTAADALGRLATPDAIAALGDILEHGTIEAQAAAAFGLGRAGTIRAAEILREQEESHPDPRVRRLCKLALGESAHEH